jgi:organic radical activating enzyme
MGAKSFKTQAKKRRLKGNKISAKELAQQVKKAETKHGVVITEPVSQKTLNKL